MNEINNARILLVLGAVAAMIGAAVLGYWSAVAVLGAGVVLHGFLWYHLYGPSKGRRGDADGATPGAPRPR